MNPVLHETEELSCEQCGSPDHITGLGQCPKLGKWWPQCCYCCKKNVDVRENGAYYGCAECLEGVEQRFTQNLWMRLNAGYNYSEGAD
jgi:hypothetical protein